MKVTLFKNKSSKLSSKGQIIDLIKLLQDASSSDRYDLPKDQLPIIQAHSLGYRISKSDIQAFKEYESDGLLTIDIDCIGGIQKTKTNEEIYKQKNKDALPGILQFIKDNKDFLKFIKYITVSASYNLHLFCYCQNLKDWYQYSDNYFEVYDALYKKIIKIIKSVFDWNNYKLHESSLDEHNSNLAQPLFINKSSFYVINEEDNFEIHNFSIERKVIDYNSDVTYNYNFYEDCNNNIKLTADKNLIVAGYSGNNLRWRIASALDYLFNGDINKRIEFVQKHFTNHSEINAAKRSYGLNNEVKEWLISTFSLKEHSNKSDILEEDISEFVDEFVYIEDDGKKYISEYSDVLNKYIDEKALVIAHPGLGKSYFISKNYDCIFVPYNSIKSGAFDSNTQAYVHNVACLNRTKSKNNIYKEIEGKKIAFDEIHLLSDNSDFRKESELQIELFKNRSQVTLFTATASKSMCEMFKMLGFKIIRFISQPKHIEYELWKIPETSLVSCLKRIFKIETYEAIIYCSNHCRSLHGQFDKIPYISRKTFNDISSITELCTKNGYWTGNYISTKYICAGIDNQLNTGKILIVVKNDEFNWIELRQLSNRFRKADIKVIIIDNGKEYDIKQNNYSSIINRVLMKEKSEFLEEQLKDKKELFSAIRNFTEEQLSPYTSNDKTRIKGFTNLIINKLKSNEEFELALSSVMNNDEATDIYKEYLESNVLRIDNITVSERFKRAKELSSDINDQIFYLYNASKIENLNDGIRTVVKYNNLDKWAYEKYNGDLNVDWAAIDISKSQKAFVESDSKVFKVSDELEKDLLKCSDEYRMYFYTNTKRRLYNKKKQFSDAINFIKSYNNELSLTEDLNGYKLSDKNFEDVYKNVFEILIRDNINDRNWKPVTDFNSTKTIKNLGCDLEVPYNEKEESKTFKYILLSDSNIGFNTRKECYEYYLNHNLGNRNEASFYKTINTFFKRI